VSGAPRAPDTGGLVIIDAQGARRPVAFPAGWGAVRPIGWSADGKMLAVGSGTACDGEPTVSPYGAALWTVGADGSGLRRMASSVNACIDTDLANWSPDGSALVYHTAVWDPVHTGWTEYQVLLADLETGQVQTLWSGHWATAWDWTRDSGRLAIMGQPDVETPSHVYVFDRGAGRLTQVTDTASRDVRPSFSADGSLIAFERGAFLPAVDRFGWPQSGPAATEVWLINADGSQPRRVASFTCPDATCSGPVSDFQPVIPGPAGTVASSGNAATAPASSARTDP
jgi:Tol biopolymer transport system component